MLIIACLCCTAVRQKAISATATLPGHSAYPFPLREDEGEQVVRLFRDRDNIPLVHANASKQFLDALSGTTEL